eukprot:scaffold176300_cov43-Cyclotella_meneghiniana.AAC.1
MITLRCLPLQHYRSAFMFAFSNLVLAKYEEKTGTQLCGSNNSNTAKIPKEVVGDIIKMEFAIIDYLITA